MRMRTKMLAITVISVIAGTLALYIGANIIVLGSFAELEEKTVQQNVGRSLSALDNEFIDLRSKTGDYAEWDETYDFIQNGNEEYIYNNLDAPTWANLRVDLVVFISAAGQVVYGTAFQDMKT